MLLCWPWGWPAPDCEGGSGWGPRDWVLPHLQPLGSSQRLHGPGSISVPSFAVAISKVGPGPEPRGATARPQSKVPATCSAEQERWAQFTSKALHPAAAQPRFSAGRIGGCTCGTGPGSCWQGGGGQTSGMCGALQWLPGRLALLGWVLCWAQELPMPSPGAVIIKQPLVYVDERVRLSLRLGPGESRMGSACPTASFFLHRYTTCTTGQALALSLCSSGSLVPLRSCCPTPRSLAFLTAGRVSPAAWASWQGTPIPCPTAFVREQRSSEDAFRERVTGSSHASAHVGVAI